MKSAERTELLELLRRLSAESERPHVADGESQELEEQARCAALREAAVLMEAWQRNPEEAPEELLARVRGQALVATEEVRADPADSEREGRRRGWWRATFLLAEAFGVDAFGRWPKALPVASGDWPEHPASASRHYTGPTCAGARKDGLPCGGIPSRGSVFCQHHHEQEAVAIGAAADIPQEQGDELGRAVDSWLADFEQERKGKDTP